jgi:hypothetical protein
MASVPKEAVLQSFVRGNTRGFIGLDADEVKGSISGGRRSSLFGSETTVRPNVRQAGRPYYAVLGVDEELRLVGVTYEPLTRQSMFGVKVRYTSNTRSLLTGNTRTGSVRTSTDNTVSGLNALGLSVNESTLTSMSTLTSTSMFISATAVGQGQSQSQSQGQGQGQGQGQDQGTVYRVVPSVLTVPTTFSDLTQSQSQSQDQGQRTFVSNVGSAVSLRLPWTLGDMFDRRVPERAGGGRRGSKSRRKKRSYPVASVDKMFKRVRGY